MVRMKVGIVVATVAVLVLSGCGRYTAAGSVGAPAPTVSGVVAPSGGVRATVTAAEADNGRTLMLSVGDELVVRLSSTYWQFTTPPGGGAVMSLGPQAVTASTPGAGCVPGAGCGTVIARFRAVAPGAQTISADRTSCGEALRCTGTEGSYRLYLVVR